MLLFQCKFQSFNILHHIFTNAENKDIFIEINILDKTRVICLLQRRVLRDVLEKAWQNHWQVTKK